MNDGSDTSMLERDHSDDNDFGRGPATGVYTWLDWTAMLAEDTPVAVGKRLRPRRRRRDRAARRHRRQHGCNGSREGGLRRLWRWRRFGLVRNLHRDAKCDGDATDAFRQDAARPAGAPAPPGAGPGACASSDISSTYTRDTRQEEWKVGTKALSAGSDTGPGSSPRRRHGRGTTASHVAPKTPTTRSSRGDQRCSRHKRSHRCCRCRAVPTSPTRRNATTAARSRRRTGGRAAARCPAGPSSGRCRPETPSMASCRSKCTPSTDWPARTTAVVAASPSHDRRDRNAAAPSPPCLRYLTTRIPVARARAPWAGRPRRTGYPAGPRTGPS